MTSQARTVAALLLLAIVAIWGWTFVLVKDAVALYGVVPFLAVRFAIGALCLAAVCGRRADGPTVRLGAGIGLVVGLAFLLQTIGLSGSSASNTGLITGLFVVFAPLANRLLFGVKIAARLWLAIAVSLGGLALLTGAGAGGFVRGDMFTLGCAALFGLHVALLDRFAKGRDARVLALGQLLSAAALLVVAWLVRGGLAWPPRETWFALVITGVLASAAAYLVQTYAQQKLSAVEAGLIIVVEPVFAVLFGVLLHGDRFTAPQAAGGALMVGTIVALEWVSHRRGSRRQEHLVDSGP